MSSNWYVFLFAVVSIDSLCAHYRIWQLKKSAADTVAAALGTTVDVDGVALPAVDDAWKPDSAIYDGNKHLRIGRVKVSHDGYIYVGDAIFMEFTPTTKKYCRDVWTSYRQRQAQKR